MKTVKVSMISKNECQGIQITGTEHCKKINCKWQGLSACTGTNIFKTGRNSLGYKVTSKGFQKS